MTQEFLFFPQNSDHSIGAERLHQALNAAVEIHPLKFRKLPAMVDLLKIVSQEVSAFLRRKFHVRIEKQGGQIILWQAGAQSLEIDQVSLFVPDDDILRLKIAVDQNPPIRSQSFGQIFERGMFPQPF